MGVRANSDRSEPSVLRDIDQLCKLLDLLTWEKFDDDNQDNYWQSVRDMVREEDESYEAFEERQSAAESEVRGAMFVKWYDAVMAAAESVFNEHGLMLMGRRVRRKVVDRPYDFRIRPVKSWIHAAEKIVDTINGVGYFRFDSLRDFLDSGPYTVRQAVLSHLGWMRDRSKVYGTASARAIYDRAWRP